MINWCKLSLAALGILASLVSCSPPEVQHADETERALLADKPAQFIYRDVDNWVLACSNTRFCTVRSVDQSGSASVHVMITREAGPLTNIKISIVDRTADGSLVLSDWRIDNQAMTTAFRWQANPDDFSAWLEGEEAIRFIRVVAGGQNLTFIGAGNPTSVSLKGFRSALAGMDQAQSRAGTVTALVEIGQQPASTVPPALPAPTVKAAPPQPVLQNGEIFAASVRQANTKVLLENECEPDRAAHLDEAYALDSTKRLVLLHCFSGPYQSFYMAFIAPVENPNGAEVLALPLGPVKSGDRTTNEGTLVEAQWDPYTSTLSSHAKGRGLGDCGESLSWTYIGNGQWELTEQRILLRCGGGTGDWPHVFKAQVVPSAL